MQNKSRENLTIFLTATKLKREFDICYNMKINDVKFNSYIFL